MNVFYNTIVFVKDIELSRKFYEQVIGLKVEADYGTIVFFENHFVIHNANALLETVYGRVPGTNPSRGCDNLLVYFETDDLEASIRTVQESGAEIIHPITLQAWNQRVFRFYDPDRHILEIGEAMHLEYLKKTA